MSDQNISPPPVPAAVPTKTSMMAVFSLVLGILAFFTCGLAGLPGLILGIIALVKISNSGGKLKGHSLALAGTIVSGIFFILLPIFAAMLLPALGAAKTKAQEIVSMNNEKQLALAVRMYANDHTNSLPPAAAWCDALKTYAGPEKVFQCPADTTGSRCSYAFNTKLDGMNSSAVNPQTVLIFESDGGWNANGGAESMVLRYRGKRECVVAFADGHVEIVNQTRLDSLRWDP